MVSNADQEGPLDETLFFSWLTLRSPDKDCPGGKKADLRTD